MTSNLNRRGFTLIELLVVIAIIGILSAVVLASLNTARSKGADAAVKSNLQGFRTQAELVYNNYNTYGSTTIAIGACSTGVSSNIFGQKGVVDTTISLAAAIAAGAGGSECVADATGYAVAIPLKGATAKDWCVDSTGVAREIATGGLATVTCPAS